MFTIWKTYNIIIHLCMIILSQETFDVSTFRNEEILLYGTLSFAKFGAQEIQYAKLCHDEACLWAKTHYATRNCRITDISLPSQSLPQKTSSNENFVRQILFWKFPFGEVFSQLNFREATFIEIYEQRSLLTVEFSHRELFKRWYFCASKFYRVNLRCRERSVKQKLRASIDKT